MEIWLCNLEKGLEAIRKKIGHLGLTVERIEGNFGNIIFNLSNNEYWVYVPLTDEILEYRKVEEK